MQKCQTTVFRGKAPPDIRDICFHQNLPCCAPDGRGDLHRRDQTCRSLSRATYANLPDVFGGTVTSQQMNRFGCALYIAEQYRPTAFCAHRINRLNTCQCSLAGLPADHYLGLAIKFHPAAQQSAELTAHQSKASPSIIKVKFNNSQSSKKVNQHIADGMPDTCRPAPGFKHFYCASP